VAVADDVASAEGVAEVEAPRPVEALPPLDALPAVEQPEAALPVQTADGRPSNSLALPPDLRMTSPGIRLAQVKEELVAWVKTLVSAAVYAVLIVTFGFQVARVEGQSMAPTLEDQDRLIVNKLVYRIGEPRRVLLAHDARLGPAVNASLMTPDGQTTFCKATNQPTALEINLPDEIKIAEGSSAKFTVASTHMPKR